MNNIAVLIDANNVSPTWIDPIIEEAGKLGNLALKRAYGDFSNSEKIWRATCSLHAIQPVQQFPYTTGKNASDIALVIDAIDLIHTNRYSCFCIVSSDSDFARLAIRLREDGITVLGIGEQKTPDAFVKACTQFIYIEGLISTKAKTKSKSATVPATTPIAAKPKEVKPKATTTTTTVNNTTISPLDDRLFILFRTAIENTRNDEGWAKLALVGTYLTKQHPDFDSRKYGFKKLSDLAIKSNWFETLSEKSGLLVRLKQDKANSAE